MVATVPQERYKQALALVDQGTVSIRAGRLEEAQAAFSLAEELVSLAAAVDGQGCVALLKGEFELAEKLFERAYQMDGTYDHALANMALLKDISGNHEEAQRLYERALTSLPEYVPVRNNKAALEYELRGRKMEVLPQLEKASLLTEHPVVSENLSRLTAVKKQKN
jgi:Flp pilus assembly protein TadD